MHSPNRKAKSNPRARQENKQIITNISIHDADPIQQDPAEARYSIMSYRNDGRGKNNVYDEIPSN